MVPVLLSPSDRDGRTQTPPELGDTGSLLGRVASGGCEGRGRRCRQARPGDGMTLGSAACFVGRRSRLTCGNSPLTWTRAFRVRPAARAGPGLPPLAPLGVTRLSVPTRPPLPLRCLLRSRSYSDRNPAVLRLRHATARSLPAGGSP